MGTKWVIQLPTLNIDLMLYVLRYFMQELFGVLPLFQGQIVPLWASYVG